MNDANKDITVVLLPLNQPTVTNSIYHSDQVNEVLSTLKMQESITAGLLRGEYGMPQCTKRKIMLEQSTTISTPPGFYVAGNYGDGKWRVCHINRPQTYLGHAKDTAEEAGIEAFRLSKLPDIDIVTKSYCR
jgi:hypothetical protein